MNIFYQISQWMDRQDVYPTHPRCYHISLGLKYYKLEYQGAMHQNRGPAGGWVIATIYFCNWQTDRKWLTVKIWLTLTIMEYHGLSWTIMDYHRLSWTIIDCHGLSWSIMDCHGLSWTVMDCHGLSWIVMDCHGPPYYHGLSLQQIWYGQMDKKTNGQTNGHWYSLSCYCEWKLQSELSWIWYTNVSTMLTYSYGYQVFIRI